MNELKPVRFGLAESSSHAPAHGSIILVCTIGIASIAIAHASGALSIFRVGAAKLWLDQIYAVTVGVGLWWGTLWLNRRMRLYRKWVRRPVVANFLPACFNTALVGGGACLSYVAWRWLFGHNVNWYVAEDLGLMAAAFTALAGFAYRLSFVNALRVHAIRRLMLLKHSEMTAQMAALKAQLDPHFLLNSINVLCHLIETSPAVAVKFADNLAWTYQYVLDKGQADLVSLQEELEFVVRYFHLIQLRFGSAVTLTIENEGIDIERMRIPPLAMQTLIENAVKHNEFSNLAPLAVRVIVRQEGVTAINRVQRRSTKERSEGLGLINLGGRVRLLTGLNLNIDRSGEQFVVKVPLVEAVA